MTASLLGLVSIALSLSGFGVDPNPNAASGVELVSRAPARSDFMAYVDLEVVLPKNYAALKKLVSQGQLSAVPELQRELESALGQMEMGLGMIKGASGVDPIRDLKSIAAWVRIPKRGEPILLVHIRGNFPKNLISTMASATGGAKTVKVGGRTAIVEDKMMLASARDGSLLFGTPKLVRKKATQRPYRRRARPGTTRYRTIRMLDQKPFFSMVSSPSRTALRRLQKQIGRSGENALSDMISGHSFFGASTHHNGLSWKYVAKSRAGLDRARSASQGLLQLMRAGHFAGRGLANLLSAAVESYRGQSKELDAVIKAKPQLMALVDEFFGDGKFVERIDVDERRRTLTVKATGDSLSDVFPLAGVLPIGVGGAYFLVAGQMMAPPPPQRAMKKPVKRRKPRPRKKR